MRRSRINQRKGTAVQRLAEIQDKNPRHLIHNIPGAAAHVDTEEEQVHRSHDFILTWKEPLRSNWADEAGPEFPKSLKFFPELGTSGGDWGVLVHWKQGPSVHGESRSLIFSAGITTFATYGCLAAVLEPAHIGDLRKLLGNPPTLTNFAALVRVPVSQSIVDEDFIRIAAAVAIG
jgi:hypothetical protein